MALVGTPADMWTIFVCQVAYFLWVRLLIVLRHEHELPNMQSLYLSGVKRLHDG